MSVNPTDRRSAILDADDRVEEVIQEPKWGGPLLLVEPDAESRGELGELMAASDEGRLPVGEMYVTLVVLMVCDPDTRERLFTMEDREALSRKSGQIVERVASRCLDLSGLKPESVDEGKDGSGSELAPPAEPTSDSLSSSA